MTDSESILFTNEAEILACRLDRIEMRELMAAYASLAGTSLRNLRRDATSLAATFSRTATSEGEIERIVAIENECCPFMRVTVKRARNDVLVTYSGPSMIGPVLDMIEERLRAGSG